MVDVLVCVPLDWEHLPTSVQKEAACGHTVWVAPSGQQLLEDRGEEIEVRCVPCTAKLRKEHLAEGGEEPEVVAPPGVLAEVEGVYGVGFRDQMETLMQRIGVTPNG